MHGTKIPKSLKLIFSSLSFGMFFVIPLHRRDSLLFYIILLSFMSTCCYGDYYYKAKTSVVPSGLTIRSKFMVFTKEKNIAPFNDTFILNEITSNITTPLDCSTHCLHTSHCCGFYFKSDEYCKLTNQSRGFETSHIEEGVNYYELKSVCHQPLCKFKEYCIPNFKETGHYLCKPVPAIPPDQKLQGSPIRLEFYTTSRNLIANNSLVVIKEFLKTWLISFDVKPNGRVLSKYSNILHVTTGENNAELGNRILFIGFEADSFRVRICFDIRGKKNHCETFSELANDTYTNIKATQRYENDGDIYFSLFINDAEVYNRINTDPQAYTDVHCYASNPWALSANAAIKNIVLETTSNPTFFEPFTITGPFFPRQNGIIGIIDVMYVTWQLSFEINPITTNLGYINIIHFTLGSNMDKNGDRTPAIFLEGDTLKLTIASGINGKETDTRHLQQPLIQGVYNYINISQHYVGGEVHYIVYLNHMKMLDLINLQPTEFKDVIMYASNPWHVPANALIRNLFFQTIPDDMTDLNSLVGSQPFGVEKSKELATISILPKHWHFSFEIKPILTKPIQSNVFYFQPAQGPSMHVHMLNDSFVINACLLTEGDWKICFTYPALSIGIFNSFVIEQVSKTGATYLQAYMNRKLVDSQLINDTVEEHKNMQVYGSVGDIHDAANVIIRNFVLRNDD